MKKLFDADIFLENEKNKVRSEKIQNIQPNVMYRVEHSIYFAETLTVFEDDKKTKFLVLGSDYEYAELDSIATEQSNKDCYRSILFLKAFSTAYIDYHSYGDVITADLFNDVFVDIDALNKQTKRIQNDISILNADIKNHAANAKAHAANEGAVPERIALRTKSGTLKAAKASSADDLVTLEQSNTAIDNVRKEADSKIIKAKEYLTEKINIEKSERVAADAAFSAKLEAEKTERRKEDSQLSKKIDTTSKADRDFAANTINKKIKELINNAPAEFDTLKELADALNKNKDGIAAINTALTNRYTKSEADNRFERKGSGGNVNLEDVFKFKKWVAFESIDNVIDSGFYSVGYSSHSGALLVFNTHSSTGVVQFLKKYWDSAHWEYRNAIDCNTSRWTEWRVFSSTAEVNALKSDVEKKLLKIKNETATETAASINIYLAAVFKNGYIRWPGTAHPSAIFNHPSYRWVKIMDINNSNAAVCEEGSNY